MKISELPNGLRHLAEKRREEDASDIDNDVLEEAFGFALTPEGYHYWFEIEEGNFTPYYNCSVKIKERKQSLSDGGDK